MEPLDKVIKDLLKEICSPPVRCGGLSIPIFTEKATSDFAASVTITASLATIMMQQSNKLPDMDSVKRARSEGESKLSSKFS